MQQQEKKQRKKNKRILKFLKKKKRKIFLFSAINIYKKKIFINQLDQARVEVHCVSEHILFDIIFIEVVVVLSGVLLLFLFFFFFWLSSSILAKQNLPI